MIDNKTHNPINTFSRPEKVIAAAITNLFKDRSGKIFISVGGPGGCAKTTFSAKLASLLPEAAILTLDNYKKTRKQRAELGLWGPHPQANRIDLAIEHIKELRAGNSIEAPLYDLETGEYPDTIQYNPVRFNIIEGEIATFEHFRELFDFSIFIDSDLKTQLKTRLGRDMVERGHSCEKAITNFLKSNIQEFEQYGAGTKSRADVHIYCDDDYNLVLESIDNRYMYLFEAIIGQMKQTVIEGLIVPLPTPFNEDETICRKALIDHLKWLYANGVCRVLVSGTTGEFFSLGYDERIELLDIVREHFPGMVMFQAGTESLGSTVKLVQKAVRHGADVIMVLPPYYFSGAPKSGLVQYFKSVAEICQVPMVLYNFPKHTGNPVTSEVLTQVAHSAIKDSSAQCELIPFTPCYLIGSSSKIVEPMRMGAKGFVSSMANCFPSIYVQLERSLEMSEFTAALEIQKEIVSKKALFEGKVEILQLKKILSSIIEGYPERGRIPLVSF